MPADYNADRVQYYPLNDLAYAHYRERVTEVLTTWRESDIADINDCIEIYECKQTVDIHGHLFSDSELSSLQDNARTLFALACKHASILLSVSNIADLFETIELQYYERFWQFIVASSLFKSIDNQGFLELLRSNPHVLGDVIKYEPIVKMFDTQLTEAFKENSHYAAELIIGRFGANHHSNEAVMLPQSLANGAIDQIMLAYLDDVNANLNYVRVLEIWPQSALNVYTPSAEVLVNAKKASSRLTAELFQNSATVSVKHGLGIAITPDQKPCKGVIIEDGSITLSYSAEWLTNYTDPGTVLNNFIHVFDFVNSFGLLMVPSNRHESYSLLETLGVHAREEYPTNIGFNMRNTQAMLIVFSYRRFLLGAGARLEEALEWFFNDYIEDEFGVSGFSISLPTEETSLFDKCKSIGPEIERVIKAFQLFVDRKEIDSDYFPYIRIKSFESLPSLLEKKYIVDGADLPRYGHALFSNQSLLAHCPNNRSFDSFIEAITNNDLRSGDFYEGCSVLLKDLAEKGFISLTENGFIKATLKAKLIHKVWQYGALPMHRLPKEYKATIDELITEDLLKYSERLLTPNEADYMNYMFNDAKFSNSRALRNIYDHADGSVDDPNSQEVEQDYCFLLSLLICLVLKINEEFSVSTGKGGIEDFVDWPLVDEGMLDEVLTRMPLD